MQLPPLMAAEIDRLRAAGYSEDWLVTKVRSSAVVKEGLVKNSLNLATKVMEAVSALLCGHG